jgi:hypothetical protein
MLFVVDDVCGNYTVNQNRIDKWQEKSESIQSLLGNEQIIDFRRVKIKWFFKKRFNINTIVFLV